jgi:hypothetical protein
VKGEENPDAPEEIAACRAKNNRYCDEANNLDIIGMRGNGLSRDNDAERLRKYISGKGTNIYDSCV